MLTRAVLPWAGPLFESGDLPFFLYDHYDARGPHLSLFFAASRGRHEALAADLARCLDQALTETRSRGGGRATLTPEQLEARHAECRGRVQNAADRAPGFPPPGSFLAYSQSAGDYPFGLGARTADTAAFFTAWREICRATALRMGADPRPDWLGAVALVAGLGRALQAEGKDPACLFRYDAVALLPVLTGRLTQDGEAAAYASVSRLVSAKNAAGFESLWREELPGALSAEALRTLVRAAAGDGWGDGHPSLQPLRELLHFSLKGLGLQVVQQIPLVLHAWSRSLPLMQAADGRMAHGNQH